MDEVTGEVQVEVAAAAADQADVPYRSGFVAIIGRPNVGKSTMLNGLVGEKVAIISPRPQTTRRRIIGIRTTPEAQVIFVDTPGLHKPRHALDRYMVSVAQGAIPDADVVLWVVDASRLPTEDDDRIAVALRRANRPIIIGLNKSDLLQPADIASHTDAFVGLAEAADWMLTIASESHNLDKVWAMIVARLPEGPQLYPEDQVTDQTDRMLCAELVREAALRYLQEEVPHGIEVTIEEWAERPNGLLFIAAKILVERESHKAIVIGARGAMLKQIGSAARREVERLMGRRAFLELFVSVRPGWRESESELRRLGFDGP